MTTPPAIAPQGRPRHGASHAFMAGDGEMATLMRAHDWSDSPLGPPAGWPQSLRTVVRLMLNTGHPMYVWWGPELTCLYNDAYRESIGPERHPSSLGRPARDVWAEIWDVISPQIEQVLGGGGATWHVDHLVPITRHGRREEVYWTYSYSPIDDDHAPGGIGGVLVQCTETTRQVLTARQLAAERDRWAWLFVQAPAFMAVLEGPGHRVEMVNPAFMQVVGQRPLVGLPIAEALPEAVEQGYLRLLDRVFASGEPYSATDAVFEARPAPGAPASRRIVDFVCQPIKAADGRVTGIFVQGADITDRANAEAALRESESRFRSALIAGRMGAWETDYQAGTRTWTPEGMALFGIDLPDGRGRVGGPDDEYARALHPDYRQMAAGFHALADRQDSFPAEYWIERPDGSKLWLSGRGMVLSRTPDGKAHRLVSIMADETERKLAEQRLRVEHERLDLALGAGRMGAYDMNIKDGVLWWSAQTYRLFGVSEQTFVPTPERVIALLHPDDREGFARARADAIAAHRPFVHEFRIERPDGTQAWLGHRGHVEYDADGHAVRSFGVTMDITERKQVEQMLRDADRQKDRFIAMLAHELRNPLAPIRNAVAVLRKIGGVDATASWCHDVIDRQVDQMAHLLDDLLDASRLSHGQLRLRLQPLRLATAIERAIEIARPVIDAAAHSFSLHIPDEPLAFEGDLTRLAQVFSNILINAAKYTPRGGSIALSVERQGGLVLVSVADNGVGLEAHHLGHIFEMFGQVESSLGRSEGGQGIGLALAKGLVEMHGGTIIALSEGIGKGSRFEIRLPLASTQGGPGEARRPGAAQPAPAAPCYRVLVVDDKRDSADSLALAVEGLGHLVDVAYGGRTALLKAEAARPEIILLDLGMPDVDGFEVCRRIRATPWGASVVLIAQSGWGQERDRQKTREAGFDHHVVKPIDLDTLASLLQPRR